MHAGGVPAAAAAEGAVAGARVRAAAVPLRRRRCCRAGNALRADHPRHLPVPPGFRSGPRLALASRVLRGAQGFYFLFQLSLQSTSGFASRFRSISGVQGIVRQCLQGADAVACMLAQARSNRSQAQGGAPRHWERCPAACRCRAAHGPIQTCLPGTAAPPTWHPPQSRTGRRLRRRPGMRTEIAGVITLTSCMNSCMPPHASSKCASTRNPAISSTVLPGDVEDGACISRRHLQEQGQEQGRAGAAPLAKAPSQAAEAASRPAAQESAASAAAATSQRTNSEAPSRTSSTSSASKASANGQQPQPQQAKPAAGMPPKSPTLASASKATPSQPQQQQQQQQPEEAGAQPKQEQRPPKPTSRAERRAVQEAQKAAKAAAKVMASLGVIDVAVIMCMRRGCSVVC